MPTDVLPTKLTVHDSCSLSLVRERGGRLVGFGDARQIRIGNGRP